MSESSLPLVVVVMGAIASVAILIAIIVSNKRARKERQHRGLQWLATLRALLTHIQKHRGMTNGYLNGSEELIGDIERLQRDVSRDFSNITTVDVGIEDNSLWQGITQHWARVAGNYHNFEVDNNLSQHNHLIKNVLYLIDDLAQECDLLLLKNREQKPLHIYWRELLSAAEYIGQARAIGTGVSAAAHCDSVSRIRLNYLCQKIQSNTERLWEEIGCGSHQTSSVAALIECINHELVCDNPTISPGDFFSIATAAIDSLLEQFDQLIKEQQWS